MFNFSDFSSVSSLTLNGNASQAGNALRLTPAIADQRGSAFYSTAIDITASTSFSTQFQLQLGGGQGTGGADGMTFMLQNSAAGGAALGALGGNLGYGGIGQSIAIEFDTYLNTDANDPNNNHISLLRNGSILNNSSTRAAGIDLNSGVPINVWIDYDGGTDRLDVYLNTGAAKPGTALLSQTIDLVTAIGTKAFIGFSAATGGLSNNQDVLNWQFNLPSADGTTPPPPPPIPTPPPPLPTTGAPTFNYTSFADVSALELNGGASQSGTALRLTANAANQAGSAFYKTPFNIDGNTSFNTQFQFNLSGGTGGADGFTFMLQNAAAGIDALGGPGGALGYAGIGQSLAIEFDTYDNGADDPNGNHIAILTNGSVATSIAPQAVGIDLNSGAPVNVWIDYDGATNKLDVYLATGTTKPGTASLTQTIDLAAIVGTRAFVGFSGGTGGLTNAQDIINWQFATNASTGGGPTPPPPPPPPTSGGAPLVNYANFATVSGLKLNGNAAQSGNALRLTPAVANQVGSAFYATPFTIDANSGFSSQFQFNIGGGTGGADGFAFVLQNATAGASALGVGGGALGYGGLLKSLAIEFDTYDNPEYDDLDGNSISILQNGNVAATVVTQGLALDLNSGQPINVWLDYNGSTNQLDVYVSNSINKPTTATLSRANIDLFGLAGDQFYAGFTAGTGGLSNAHDILNWQFQSTTPAGTFVMASSDVTVREGQSFVDIRFNRLNGSDGAATIEYATKNVTATGGEDYTVQNATVTFDNGETTKVVRIPILNDALIEDNEVFGVGLVATSRGSLGTSRTVNVTILDDDAPATFGFSQTDYNVNENAGTVLVTVQRNGRIDETSTVKYTTSNDNATAGSDYDARSGTLTFAPGEDTKTFTVNIKDDTTGEVDERINLTLSEPTAAGLGARRTSVVTIKDNDTGNFKRETVASGFNRPNTFEWTPKAPDGSAPLLFVGEQAGVIKVIRNGVVSTFVDLSNDVNYSQRDRGLMGMAIHPDFYNGAPYIYFAYTYDPPGAPRDLSDNRPARVVRIKVDAASGYLRPVATSDPDYQVVILGKNSVWKYTTQNTNSTNNDQVRALPSGIVNGTTITNVPTAELDANGNIRDYLAGDSESHSIGAIRFGADKMLYVTNGDGTSYNLTDPRSVRVQDLDNLSGKMLRIDPLTGAGLSDNPFYKSGMDINSNRAKVYNYGLRNPFRFTFNPVTNMPVIGDVGWTTWEEVNTGRGQNFGWPYYEGGNAGSTRTGGYDGLTKADTKYGNNPQTGYFWSAADFYGANGPSVTAPLYAYNHNGGSNAVIVGDFYTSNAFPSRYNNSLFISDAARGWVDVLFFDAQGRYTGEQQRFESNLQAVATEMQTGPDGAMYFTSLYSGNIERWVFA